MSARLEIGFVLPLLEAPLTGEKPSWDELRSMACRAEELGFDTVWVPDELLWRVPEWSGPRGWWEAVAIAGAVAAATQTIGVGTWVLSALSRNPALTVKIAETLDEISNGRFLLGFGAGHAGDQGETFGYPADKTVSRYEEALAIIVPALRGEIVSFAGDHHQARELDIRPRGPRPGKIPLMLGAHGPRTMRLAARHADIWSAFATESSLPEWFEPMLTRLDDSCDDVGRDPATLQRSVGVFVQMSEGASPQDAGLPLPIAGSAGEIAETIGRFATIGVTRVELMLWPFGEESLEAAAPVMELLGGRHGG